MGKGPFEWQVIPGATAVEAALAARDAGLTRGEWPQMLEERDKARAEEAKQVARYNAIRVRARELRENRERREQWERMQAQRQAEAARAAEASEEDLREATAQIDREQAVRETAHRQHAEYERAQREEAERLAAVRRAAKRSNE